MRNNTRVGFITGKIGGFTNKAVKLETIRIRCTNYKIILSFPGKSDFNVISQWAKAAHAGLRYASTWSHHVRIDISSEAHFGWEILIYHGPYFTRRINKKLDDFQRLGKSCTSRTQTGISSRSTYNLSFGKSAVFDFRTIYGESLKARIFIFFYFQKGFFCCFRMSAIDHLIDVNSQMI